MFDIKKISFRKLQLEDLVLMHKWLNEPHVHEWYDKDEKNSFDDILKRYESDIKGETPTDCYFALYDHNPVAYLQTYKVNDWPEFGNYLDYDDHTSSVDLFIGEVEFIGKGLGSFILRKFLKEIVFANKQITFCIIGPEPKNKRAIKVYEKVGFRYRKTIQIPEEQDPTYIMELKKEELT